MFLVLINAAQPVNILLQLSMITSIPMKSMSCRVKIIFSSKEKHELPVDRRKCPWSHRGSMTRPDDVICKNSESGKEPENFVELEQCIKHAACPVIDDSLQMAVLRDPREVTVSSYYYFLRHEPEILRNVGLESMNDFFSRYFPLVCKWLFVRFLLFGSLIANQSSLFWYRDAVEYPARWRSQFLSFVGLNPPAFIVNETAKAFEKGKHNLGFKAQDLDSHPGGTNSRSYRDELNDVVIGQIDSILTRWLPDGFLEEIDYF